MSAVSKTYYDVVIEGKSYYILESTSKPKDYNHFSVVKKIKKIVEKELPYQPLYKDRFALWNEQKRFLFLKNISLEIYQKYEDKQKKLIQKQKILEKKLKKISMKKGKIYRAAGLPEAFPFPLELLLQISKYLRIADIRQLCLVSKKIKIQGELCIVDFAKRYGFQEGTLKEAKDYLQKAFSEIRKFLKPISTYSQKELDTIMEYEDFTHTGIKPHEIQEIKKFTENNRVSIDDLLNELENTDSKSQSFFLTDFFFGNFKVTSFFVIKNLMSKISVDTQNAKGETALMLAAQNFDQKLVEFLLDKGANPNIASKSNFTPLTINTSSPSITKLLLSHGADVHYKAGSSGKTALDFATKRISQFKTAAVLLEFGAKHS